MPASIANDDANAVAQAPVAIGGLGGSGTRVVAAAAIELGIDLGSDVNRALDNLSFTLLFKDPLMCALPADAFSARVDLFVAGMTGGRSLVEAERETLRRLAFTGRGGEDWVQHQPAWLEERARRLDVAAAASRRSGAWGWKEPNTQIVLDRLLPHLPGLRYVHVSRNALDMAFSRNTNQLMFWGPRILGRRVQPVPRDALAFWCELDRRVRKTAAAMGDRFLRIEHDALCAQPAPELSRLVAFLGASPGDVERLVPLVSRPPTAGRHQGESLEDFAAEDLAYLEACGQVLP